MSRSVRNVAGHTIGKQMVAHQARKRIPVVLIRVCSIVVLVMGGSRIHPQPPQVVAAAPVAPRAQPAAAPASSRFIIDSRETLRRLREKMTDLGAQVLAGLDMNETTPTDVASQNLMVESAKAGYLQAVLVREAAEIALKQFEEGVFPQEKKVREMELQLAQDVLETAVRAAATAKEHYAKIKQASTGAAAVLAAEWRYEAGVLSTQLEQKKAQYVLEQAQSRLKVLLDYEHGKRMKELKSSIEKARSDQLAKRANWEHERSKLKEVNDPPRSQGRLSDEKRQILALLDRVIPLEEKLSARLDELKKEDSQPGESLRKEITELIRQLRGTVGQAQGVQADAALERLKSGLLRADRSRIARAGDLPRAPARDREASTAASSRLVTISRDRLIKLQVEVLAMGAHALDRLHATDQPRDEAVNQQITVKSAEANFENAKLTREIAEIAIVEYTEGIFKQDLATLEGEVKLAESDASRSRDAVELAKFRLAKIKQASRGSTEDLALIHSYEDWVVRATQHAPRAQLELDSARSKRDVLQRFTRLISLNELKAKVEEARSDELARQARWELEKSRLKTLQEAGKRHARGIHEERVLKFLDRALPIVDQLKTRLAQAEQDHNLGEPHGKEITDMLDQLQGLVEQSQAEDAAAQWARLKPRVHDAAARYLGAQAK